MTSSRRSVYLDDDQWAALTHEAALDGRSTNNLVRKIVAEHLAGNALRAYRQAAELGSALYQASAPPTADVLTVEREDDR